MQALFHVLAYMHADAVTKGLKSTITDKFLWDTRIYFSQMHILWTSDASPLPPTQCWA